MYINKKTNLYAFLNLTRPTRPPARWGPYCQAQTKLQKHDNKTSINVKENDDIIRYIWCLILKIKTKLHKYVNEMQILTDRWLIWALFLSARTIYSTTRIDHKKKCVTHFCHHSIHVLRYNKRNYSSFLIFF